MERVSLQESGNWLWCETEKRTIGSIRGGQCLGVCVCLVNGKEDAKGDGREDGQRCVGVLRWH